MRLFQLVVLSVVSYEGAGVMSVSEQPLYLLLCFVLIIQLHAKRFPTGIQYLIIVFVSIPDFVHSVVAAENPFFEFGIGTAYRLSVYISSGND